MNEAPMSLRSAILFSFVLSASSAVAYQAPDKAAMQQRVAELKESVAANKAKLATYQWTETTTILLKGEVKKTEQNLCRYGPDGKVQKTPVGAPPEPPQQQQKGGGRLKAKIVEKKVDEMKDYGARLKSLIGEYVPPSRDKIQDAAQAGNVSVTPGAGGVSSIAISNYYKGGDKMIFGFDPAVKKLRTIAVDSYLDDPKTDIVTLAVNFASLPDGTNYTASTDLKAASKNMEIKTANSGYQKVAQ
jgi:hypothetical protein